MKSIMVKSLVVSALLFSFLLVDAVFNTSIIVNDVEARVGRPLTPGSAAGVARRTTRRNVGYGRVGVGHGAGHGVAGRVVVRRAIVRTAVFVAILPVGCPVVVVEGSSLYYCGGVYYQSSGTQYVVVNVQ